MYPIKLLKGIQIDFEDFPKKLVSLGYTRRSGISEQGDFSVKGESVLIFPSTFEYPVRIELNGETIEKIVSIDPVNFKSIHEHNAVIIMKAGSGRLYKRKIPTEADPIDVFVDISPGDYVVHIDHGIGVYLGHYALHTLKGKEECISIQYRDGDVLYVPISDMSKIQKYIHFHKKRPKIHKLGSKVWKKTKDKAVKGVLKIADDILEVQAKRASMKGFSFSKDTDWQIQIENNFPFKETNDQLKATKSVKEDMERPIPMDRLLCGDVGYGKTEVALRAAFKAVMDNKQVAILVPTTILAEQHYNTFTERMKDFPVVIEMLSRFRKKSSQEKTVESLKRGEVDIVIGTHRLLSKDISFKDLGMVIIDEEQRFGVRHKEKLKKMRLVVDILTLTATPIPRTLYLALMGGRDISNINTPPLERQPVQTNVIEFDERILKKAIEKEIKRGGQVYFVHNRIESIDNVAKRIRRLVPGIRIAIGHGRMSEKMLESTMLRFMNGDIDVLVCTTIIESGIDIQNANTLFVDRAEHFGIADLYQLRGRVGRFNRRAYAYFIVRNKGALTHDEQRRLDAIRKFTELGSGFKIAMQDLELRGAGNLMGIEQHGYIEQVGFDMYCRFLRNAINQLSEQ